MLPAQAFARAAPICDLMPTTRAAAARAAKRVLLDLSLDELGPIVIKEDGRLGRLSNWQDMTEGEQQATLKFVAKRNAKRRKALLKAQSEAG